MKNIFFLLLFVSLQNIIINQRNQKIITKEQWVQYLIDLAKRETKYFNTPPYNLLYFDGEIWYADCVNLHKALFNGRNIYDYTPDIYQEDLDNTGDIDANEMINLCTEISSDFKKLKQNEPRILYVHGHIGAYLGKIISTPEGLCNVVETTNSFGEKIAFSWVDPDGKRRNVKNGFIEGKWIKHGLPSLWVSY